MWIEHVMYMGCTPVHVMPDNGKATLPKAAFRNMDQCDQQCTAQSSLGGRPHRRRVIPPRLSLRGAPSIASRREVGLHCSVYSG